MSLSDLASIGTFVSGLAVLVSIVYLAQRTRQTVPNQPATVNPPTGNKSDRHKGRSGRDDAGTGTNHPK